MTRRQFPLRKRYLICLLFFVCGPICLPSAAATTPYAKPRPFVVFCGEISFLSDGHFGDMVEAGKSYFGTLHDPGAGHVVSWDEGRHYLGYEGEIGIRAGRYAVGIGVGFLSRRFYLEYDADDPVGGGQNILSWDRRFSAVPIMLYNHFYFLDSKVVSAHVTLGGGVYLGEYRDLREDAISTAASNTTILKTIEGRRNFLGLHLGVALELNLGQNLALFAEAMGRIVSFKDISATDVRQKDGEITNEKEGDLEYIVNGETGEEIFWVGEYDDPWSGAPAELKMNGVALRVGLKITLGKKLK